MNKALKESYHKYHRKKTDRELVIIAFFERKSYHANARASAKDIIKERKLTDTQIEILKKDIRASKAKERKNSKKKSGGGDLLEFLLEFFLSR